MKKTIYISGVLGGLLLIIYLIGETIDFSFNDIFLIVGLIIIVLVFIPLLIVDRHRYNKKIDHIIKTHKDKPSKIKDLPPNKSKIKGRNLNNLPFRERKSGLTWGGGNIKGSLAKRGTKRKFLK